MKLNIKDIIQEIKEIVTETGVTPEQAINVLQISEQRKNNILMEQKNKYIRIYINEKCSPGTWILLDSIDKELNTKELKKND